MRLDLVFYSQGGNETETEDKVGELPGLAHSLPERSEMA